jgi:hypothetical protein
MMKPRPHLCPATVALLMIPQMKSAYRPQLSRGQVISRGPRSTSLILASVHRPARRAPEPFRRPGRKPGYPASAGRWACLLIHPPVSADAKVAPHTDQNRGRQEQHRRRSIMTSRGKPRTITASLATLGPCQALSATPVMSNSSAIDTFYASLRRGEGDSTVPMGNLP